MMGPRGFIMRKLGPEALEELNEETAKGCAADMKERGVDDALKFAMNYGVVNKNIFGSDVEVEGNPNRVCNRNCRRHKLTSSSTRCDFRCNSKFCHDDSSI